MEILYQDDKVVVCVKPAGILSTDEPGGAPELIRRALGDGSTVRSVHRLDRAAAGVMVYARTRRAAADLSGQMRDGQFCKRYLAVAQGRPEAPSGIMEDFLHRDRRERKTYIVEEGSQEAQLAVLEYELLAVAEGLSLLSILLRTGRTHQIRCQLSGRGMPLVGDKKYGGTGNCNLALWSCGLEFIHPKTGQPMSFHKRPPDAYPWNIFSECI